MLRTGFLLLQLASQLVEVESERQKVLSAAFSLLDDQVHILGRLLPEHSSCSVLLVREQKV